MQLCTRCHSTLACSALTRVSLARFTLATSILARFHFGAFLFGAFPNFVRTYDDPVSANASFARTVSYLRRSVCYASLTRFSFCAYVDRICEYGIVFSVFLMPGSLFAYFSFMCRIVRIISLLTSHRGHTIYLFISRL